MQQRQQQALLMRRRIEHMGSANMSQPPTTPQSTNPSPSPAPSPSNNTTINGKNVDNASKNNESQFMSVASSSAGSVSSPMYSNSPMPMNPGKPGSGPPMSVIQAANEVCHEAQMVQPMTSMPGVMKQPNMNQFIPGKLPSYVIYHFMMVNEYYGDYLHKQMNSYLSLNFDLI